MSLLEAAVCAFRPFAFHSWQIADDDDATPGTTCGQGGIKPGFVTSPGIYRELTGLEQFGRRGPGGDVRFSLHRLSFQRGRWIQRKVYVVEHHARMK